MDWISETQDFLNGSFTRNEFVKGELVKSIEYLQGRDGPYTVRIFSGENKFTEEYYAIGGTLVYRYEWLNGEIVSQWP
jgi:hypothetical protein